MDVRKWTILYIGMCWLQVLISFLINTRHVDVLLYCEDDIKLPIPITLFTGGNSDRFEKASQISSNCRLAAVSKCPCL
jgi:hypothetical protein